MILIAALALAFAWALACGGSLLQLTALPLNWGGIALVAFALQSYLIWFPEPRSEGLSSPRVWVLIGSYLLLLSFIWKNRGLPGMWLIGAGLVANFAVMLANGGYMPITREALAAVGRLNHLGSVQTGTRLFGTKDIVLPREETRLWFLSDIFVLAPPFPIPSVFSLGDVLIAGGAFWLVQRALGAGRRLTVTEI